MQIDDSYWQLLDRLECTAKTRQEIELSSQTSLTKDEQAFLALLMNRSYDNANEQYMTDISLCMPFLDLVDIPCLVAQGYLAYIKPKSIDMIFNYVYAGKNSKQYQHDTAERSDEGYINEISEIVSSAEGVNTNQENDDDVDPILRLVSGHVDS